MRTRITITVDPEVGAYAEELVSAGKAASVSAAFNDALSERAHRDRRARRWWAEKAAEAATDPMTAARVARVRAHVDAELRRFERDHGRS